MGAEDRVEVPDEEGYRSLGKMLQRPVRNTVWVRSLGDLETPDGFVNLVRVVYLGFAGWVRNVVPQRHVNHLNNCWDRRNS